MKRAICNLLLLPFLLLPAQERDSQKRLEAIGERIEEINRKLESLKAEKVSALDEITRLELIQEKVRIEFNRLELDQRRVQSQINRKNREKEALEKKIESSKEILRNVLRVLYKTGEMAYIRFFFSLDNFEQLFRNYYLFDRLLRTKLSQINEIRLSVEQLQQVKTDLQDKIDEMEKLKGGKRQKLAQLRSLRGQKLTWVSRINQERDLQMGVLDDLKREAERLNRLLGQSVSGSESYVDDLSGLEGKLSWPLKGKIVSTFGKKKSPLYDTYTINNGVEIKPTEGLEIHSILDGEVIFADYLSALYGNIIVVQHKRTFHTLYGHCSEILKRRGDRVKKGEVIAIVGDTGATDGDTLYFEVRENLRAVDPLKWLGRR